MTEQVAPHDLESEESGEDERLGIDVATVPELDDDELSRVLEALLLVVDTPISVAGLAAVTDQPEHRIAAALAVLAAEPGMAGILRPEDWA